MAFKDYKKNSKDDLKKVLDEVANTNKQGNIAVGKGLSKDRSEILEKG